MQRTTQLCIEEQLTIDFNTTITHAVKRTPRYDPYLAWQFLLLKDVVKILQKACVINEYEIRWRFNEKKGQHYFNNHYAPTIFIPSKRIAIDVFPTLPTQLTYSNQNFLRIQENIIFFNYNFAYLKANKKELQGLIEKHIRKEELRKSLNIKV